MLIHAGGHHKRAAGLPVHDPDHAQTIGAWFLLILMWIIMAATVYLIWMKANS
jgi:hypothetical protein